MKRTFLIAVALILATLSLACCTWYWVEAFKNWYVVWSVRALVAGLPQSEDFTTVATGLESRRPVAHRDTYGDTAYVMGGGTCRN